MVVCQEALDLVVSAERLVLLVVLDHQAVEVRLGYQVSATFDFFSVLLCTSINSMFCLPPCYVNQTCDVTFQMSVVYWSAINNLCLY